MTVNRLPSENHRPQIPGPLLYGLCIANKVARGFQGCAPSSIALKSMTAFLWAVCFSSDMQLRQTGRK